MQHTSHRINGRRELHIIAATDLKNEHEHLCDNPEIDLQYRAVENSLYLNVVFPDQPYNLQFQLGGHELPLWCLHHTEVYGDVMLEGKRTIIIHLYMHIITVTNYK